MALALIAATTDDPRIPQSGNKLIRYAAAQTSRHSRSILLLVRNDPMADEPTVIATRLRFVGAISVVLGFFTLLGTLFFTQTADALVIGVWVALLCFGLPAASAIAVAHWVDMRAGQSNAGDMEES